jgi:hypothetical protein
LFLGILLTIEVAYRVGLRRWARLPEERRGVSSTIEAAVFSLLGLLIAFTFYGAGSRFDNRRAIVGLEANTMSTTYLRLDLLPPSTQPALREQLRNYVRCRIDVLNSVEKPQALSQNRSKASTLQRIIWDLTVTALKDTGPATQTLVLTSLNDMIDASTTSAVAALTHPPFAVFLMLLVTIVAAAAVIGYSAAARQYRDWISISAFALILSAAVYMTFDYEYPRAGLIRIDPVDRVLTQVLDQMK